jgi:hypothetical protein
MQADFIAIVPDQIMQENCTREPTIKHEAPIPRFSPKAF